MESPLDMVKTSDRYQISLLFSEGKSFFWQQINRKKRPAQKEH